MPRKPKAKNTLSAGERVALYEAEQEEKRRRALAERSGEDISDGDAENGENVSGSEISADVAVVEKPVKRELPKPQKATVKVDLSLVVGDVPPLHGMCNGPVSYGADLSHLFKEAGVPTVRLADTCGGAYRQAFDLAVIFPRADADPLDEAAYNFGLCDACIASVYNSGARAVFCLFDSSGVLYADSDRFVEVAVKVISHYNDYWANGYAYGIEYFELPYAIDKGADAIELYTKSSRALKLFDGEMKVGTPCISPSDRAFGDFVRACAKKHAPIDFVSLSLMSSEVSEAISDVRRAVAMLKNSGYRDCEIIIGEWSYVDSALLREGGVEALLSASGREACEERRNFFTSQSSIKGAAYALSLMLGLGGEGSVSLAHFCDAEPMISPWCAICDRYGNPEKAYGAFLAYGELYRAREGIFAVSEQTEGYAHTGIYASAARDKDGRAVILISSFNGCGTVDLRIEGIPENLYTADVYILDGVKDLELGDSVPISGQKKRLILDLSEYAAVMIKLY